jgi:AcrR family transcriptional regulator
MERTKATSEARQRILETADRLFYQDGLRAVGIDRIIAEAGVAKMSLYKHFPSKDDLILAVLKYREEKILAFFGTAMERHSKRTKDKLRAFFASLKDLKLSGRNIEESDSVKLVTKINASQKIIAFVFQ